MPEPRLLLLNCDDIPSENVRGFKRGIQRYAGGRGWSVVEIPQEKSGKESLPALLAEHKPVGCIVLDYRGETPLRSRHFGKTPVVFLDSPETKRGCMVSVVSDNATVAHAAFRELSSCLAQSFAIVPSRTMRAWNKERIAAFKAKCKENGLSCAVFKGKRPEDAQKRLLRLKEFVKKLPKRCGVFGINDNAAADVAAAAVAVGKSIPRDILIVGVDGFDTTDLGFDLSRISSVEIDFERGGFLAAATVADLAAAKPGRSRGAATHFFGPLLVLRRESTRGFGRRAPSVLSAVEMIRREACDGLTAHTLATRFPGSRNLFERRFREARGHSVLDEIIQVRLEKAQILLSRRDVPISAVAGLCGFGCEYGLRKLFRSRFGVSMREWRNGHR